jgi:hypothetical protein
MLSKTDFSITFVQLELSISGQLNPSATLIGYALLAALTDMRSNVNNLSLLG